MTTKTEGQYLFPHTWEGEGDRLTALTTALDPITRRHLLGRGLTDGWRCLEVGAGTGSIARWMAEQVGPKGRVLATDLSLELMHRQGLEAQNLELRRHDVLSDPMPDEEFDLIHCRLVLEHLPGRLDALARLAGALAPGGWLVVEEMTFGSEKAGSFRGAAMLSGLVTALRLMLQRRGFDGAFGRRLPIHFARLGLAEVGAEGTQVVLIGGTPSVEWVRPTFGRIRHLLLDHEAGLVPGPLRKTLASPLRGVLERRLERLERLLADPEFVYLAPTFVSVWARRPAAAT
ncbi:MAG: methyltransferase domain-containing protein [Actinobacteria bacterium]|nr:methyltransferase domain-containing protein [Actinomycetota bacterium]